MNQLHLPSIHYMDSPIFYSAIHHPDDFRHTYGFNIVKRVNTAGSLEIIMSIDRTSAAEPLPATS